MKNKNKNKNGRMAFTAIKLDTSSHPFTEGVKGTFNNMNDVRSFMFKNDSCAGNCWSVTDQHGNNCFPISPRRK